MAVMSEAGYPLMADKSFKNCLTYYYTGCEILKSYIYFLLRMIRAIA